MDPKTAMLQELLERTSSQPRIACFDRVSQKQLREDIVALAKAGEMAQALVTVNKTRYYVESIIRRQELMERFMVEVPIRLPERATTGSAGYDLFSPFQFRLGPGESISIPTGLRCAIDPNWVLSISPKSGKGCQYRVMMRNTIGWIDSDYYHAANEGHIILKIINDNYDGRALDISAGTAIMQGIFLPYGVTVDDDADGVRRGGFGSTGK